MALTRDELATAAGTTLEEVERPGTTRAPVPGRSGSKAGLGLNQQDNR